MPITEQIRPIGPEAGMGHNMIIRKKITLRPKAEPIMPTVLKKPLANQSSLANKEQGKVKEPPIVIRKKITLKRKETLPEGFASREKFNKYLDSHFIHHLMGIKDTWSEVKYKIRLDSRSEECWWDLEMLLTYFAELLNSSVMTNPAPQWPSNPFNRIPFEKSQLLGLAHQVYDLQLPVNYMISSLFAYLQTDFNSINPDRFDQDFLSYLSKVDQYRFKIMNTKDSQGNYLGYWVPKTEPFSTFELQFARLKQIPPREYNPIIDRLVETLAYRIQTNILNGFPPETVDFEITSRSLLTTAPSPIPKIALIKRKP